MGRKKTVQRNKKSSSRITSRHKKIKKTQNLQNKIPGWDQKLSFTANLDKLGINNFKINEKISKISQLSDQSKFIEAEEIDIKQIQKLILQQEVPKDKVEQKKNKVRMSIDEEWAVESLVNKYKQNFELMSRDHKVNTFQWTQIQCKNKYEDYIKRYKKCPK